MVRGVVLSAPALLLAACSAEPVAVPAVDVRPDDRAACESLVEAVPDDLGGRERAAVTPSDALGAAWGDPPIVMTCGGEAPDISRTAECQEVDGVGWYVDPATIDDESVDATLVAVGHRPVVTLDVPADQRPEGAAAAMAGVAEAVLDHTEIVQPCV